ncbi:transposase family protein [Salinicoccus roseus]|nr:transposase family protein [Salinicoccus roseus]
MYTHFADLDSRLIVLSCIEDANTLTCVVTVVSKTGRCPHCHSTTSQRHSAYMRVIDDLPIQGRRVQLYLKARKWFCSNALCATKVFTERFDWLVPYGQRTIRLDEALRTIAFSSSCVQGATVTRQLGMPVSHDTLLRLIHKTEMPVSQSPFCGH